MQSDGGNRETAKRKSSRGERPWPVALGVNPRHRSVEPLYGRQAGRRLPRGNRIEGRGIERGHSTRNKTRYKAGFGGAVDGKLALGKDTEGQSSVGWQTHFK